MILAAALIGWGLALAAAALVRGQRRRLELVGDADHELRGPVTVLALGIEALDRDPACRGRAGALAGELERLRCGLDDLAAARRGIRRTPLREPVWLHGLVSGSAAGWAPAAARAGRELVFDWRAGPIRIVGDRGRLAQLFGNLISNALEHGGGRIELRGEQCGGSVRVEVRDEGPRSVAVHGAKPNPTAARDASADPLAAAVSGPDRGRGLRISRLAAAEAGGELSVHRDDAGTLAAVELPLKDR